MNKTIKKIFILGAVCLMAICPAIAALHGSLSGMTILQDETTAKTAAAPDSTCSDTISPVSLDSLLASTSLFDRMFLEAVCQRNAGNDSLASLILDSCAKTKEDAAEMYFLKSNIYSDADNDSLAFIYMKRASKLQPDNDTYNESVANTYIKQGKYGKAIHALEKFYTTHRDRSDLLNILLALYLHGKDYDKALSTLDRMDKVDGKSEDNDFTRLRIYEQIGDTKSSYRTLKSIVDEHPFEPNYMVMLGNWLYQKDRKKEAYGFFQKALKLDSENAFTLNSLADYYKGMGDVAASDSIKQRMLFSPKTDAETRARMLVDYVLNNRDRTDLDSTAMIAIIDRTMAAAPHDADLSNIKAVYLEKIGMPADSVNAAFMHTLEVAPDDFTARSQLIQRLWMKWDKVEKLALQGTQYNPEEPTFFYFLAIAQFQKDRLPESIKTLQTGINVAAADKNPNSGLISDMYAMIGDSYMKLEEADKAFAAYDSCLQWKDDNIMALNNYAYYLSDKNGDLKKAEAMSRKTIEAEPTNSTYLDTYAWILYLLERYDEAKAYIDRALENDTDSVPSAVVIEHAGDIYCKSGEKERAAELWQKAIECGGDKAVLTRKIKTKSVDAKN